jgi:hypothetical protein
MVFLKKEPPLKKGRLGKINPDHLLLMTLDGYPGEIVYLARRSNPSRRSRLFP